MSLTIQRATSAEIPAILDVLNWGVQNKIRRGDLAWGEKNVEAASVEPFVANGTAYIATLDGQVIGTFMLSWQDDINWGKQLQPACYLQRFAVAAGFSGQNIGGQILDLVVSTVKEQGNLSSIRLVCPSANPKLRAYYERQGFSRADGKASPTLPRTDIVYYEHSISTTNPDQHSAKKQSLLSKLKSSKLFRSSE